MSAKQDVMYRNHAVSPDASDALISGEDRMQMQFTRLVTMSEGKKYVRATVSIGLKQYKEIVETYGLADIIVSRWEVWDKELKKNVPFQS